MLKSKLKILNQSAKELNGSIFTKEFGPWSGEEKRLIRDLPNKPVQICCYLNSLKYFACKHKKSENTLKSIYLKKADNFLFSIRGTVFRINNRTDITFVGVHIRMGDVYLDKQLQKTGFRVAPTYYIQTAMDHYRKNYYNVHFIICTDNIKWTREHGATMSRDVHLASVGVDVEEMALLSRCNHSIMTQGTFGWWSSFLAEGEVVYYHPPVKPASGIFNMTYRRENLYPPHWTCYTDDPHGEKLNYVRPCKSSDQT